MYGYIYKTTNKLNGKVYIGQHRAKEFDQEYKGSGEALWNAIRKYGWKEFIVEMLDKAHSREELDRKEIYWIKFYRERGECYNIAAGGQGVKGYVYTPEDRRKMSEAHKAWARLPENKEKLSQRMKGRKLSAETKRKISEANKGKHFSRKGVSNEKVAKALRGRKRPDIARALRGKKRPDIAESNRRRIVSEETRRKMSEAHKRK